MNESRSPVLACAFALAAVACGARTSLEVEPGARADASADAPSTTDVALELPLGVYTGCALSTVEVRPKLEATGGGRGAVTISTDGDGRVIAELAFGRWGIGRVVFAPTSRTTAASTEGPFDLATLDTDFASPLTIRVAAGSLALIGDRLFLGLLGRDDPSFAGYCTCPVPAGLPSTTIVSSAPAGSLRAGTYAHCTTSFGGYDTSITTGGDLTLTIAETASGWSTTKIDGFPDVCDLAFDGAGTTATLVKGRTCVIAEPCGPPPSLGPSSAPSKATLTGMAGSLQLVGGALFVDVVGDAPPEACGAHFLSLRCPSE